MQILKIFLIQTLLIGFTLDSNAYTDNPLKLFGWEHLGTRKVDYKLDRDEIPVTIREGKFRKIKLTAHRGDINMHQCIVTFGDGTRQIVNMRKRINAGSSTRVIDLKGGSRVIKKVTFLYDTKGIKSKKGKIKLYGLR